MHNAQLSEFGRGNGPTTSSCLRMYLDLPFSAAFAQTKNGMLGFWIIVETHETRPLLKEAKLWLLANHPWPLTQRDSEGERERQKDRKTE